MIKKITLGKDFHNGWPWWAWFPPPWFSLSPELPHSTERFAGTAPYFNFTFGSFSTMNCFGEKTWLLLPTWLPQLCTPSPPWSLWGWMPPTSGPTSWWSCTTSAPHSLSQTFSLLKSLPNFTEGPLPYAFFEYFFTTQSASMTALSIICSTRSGSWRDVFFKISFSISYPPPRPSAVHILSSQTVYRTEKQCR